MDYIIHEFTTQQAAELFEGHCQWKLGIGTEEFLRRYKAGEYAEALAGGPLHVQVSSLVLLLPLICEDRACESRRR